MDNDVCLYWEKPVLVSWVVGIDSQVMWMIDIERTEKVHTRTTK